MSNIMEQLDGPARAMGIPRDELADIVRRGRTIQYEPGACLFHESTPREWLGIVVDGEVEVVRGLHGRQTHLATLTDGAVMSEGVLLDECAHSSSAYARGDRVFHQKFGYGIVEGIDDTKLDIAFDKAGRKKVLDSFVEPSK